MKNYLLGILFILFIIVSIYSCSKTGPPPTCKITYPLDGQIIEKCETIDITVVVEGKGTETSILVDGESKVMQHIGSSINYVWSTYMDNTGKHTIKAICGSKNGNAIDEITIKIVTGNGVTFTDPRDMKEYYIVEIGSQTWFAQDLNFNTNDTGCFENYDGLDNYLGILYYWNTARTACPSGWHLPSDSEWKTLEKYIGMSNSEADETGWRGSGEGGELKSKCGWYPGGIGNDSYRFTAMPNNKMFGTFGDRVDFWSNTEGDYSFVYMRSLSDNSDEIGRVLQTKEYKSSIRCVKD